MMMNQTYARPRRASSKRPPRPKPNSPRAMASLGVQGAVQVLTKTRHGAGDDDELHIKLPTPFQ